MKYLISLLLLLGSDCIFSHIALGQMVFSLSPDTLFVSKRKCDCDHDGYSLQINEDKNTFVQKKCGDFSYGLLYTAKMEHKIRLIEQLLQFENDTSFSCSRVKCYSNAAKKYSDCITSNKYSLQISALFHINLICFGEFGPFKYSPFPVLIEVDSNREINSDAQSIGEVFQIYKQWFIKAKESGFHNYTFPLIGTKYQWKFGDYSKRIVFKTLPVIKSDFKYRIGRPY